MKIRGVENKMLETEGEQERQCKQQHRRIGEFSQCERPGTGQSSVVARYLLS
jgi:hypothetical protein